jgi:hypothetical protein
LRSACELAYKFIIFVHPHLGRLTASPAPVWDAEHEHIYF